ncbi:MAG: hypothetical protein H7Y18_09745 [Clostridiaceae bacterium]|nr:hypothetical protein [Clostridiaceae bacterium]
MVKEKEIKVITLGRITLEDKRNYARAMARALMSEYGKETCERVLVKLKNSL